MPGAAAGPPCLEAAVRVMLASTHPTRAAHCRDHFSFGDIAGMGRPASVGGLLQVGGAHRCTSRVRLGWAAFASVEWLPSLAAARVLQPW